MNAVGGRRSGNLEPGPDGARGTAVLWFNQPADGAPPDSVDVLAQVSSIRAALESLGYRTCELPFALDLEALRAQLSALRPALVVNLVESVDEDGSRIHLAPAMLEALGVRYTGCPSRAMFLATNKLLAKRLLLGHGVATPAWLGEDDAHGALDGGDAIVKAVDEDASIGLDDGSVVSGLCRAELLALLARKREGSGRAWFAERYVPGRELNIAMLGGPGGPELMPVAEILFPDSWAGRRHQILDYRSKWDETSDAFHTRRRFDFPAGDQPLLAEIRRVAALAWRAFGLRGYARADFRVDAAGTPWLLEVNPNPGIAPDSGFVAAVERAGLQFADVVARLVQLA